MQPSVERERLLAAVDAELAVLEGLCATIERALTSRDWDAMQTAFFESRRAAHALANAMEDAEPVRDERFDAHVFTRVRRVYAIREGQRARIQSYHDAVGDRLALIARWKDAVRTLGKGRRLSTLGTLDQLT